MPITPIESSIEVQSTALARIPTCFVKLNVQVVIFHVLTNKIRSVVICGENEKSNESCNSVAGEDVNGHSTGGAAPLSQAKNEDMGQKA